MKHGYFAIIACLLTGTAVRAHHIWLVPEESDGSKARAVFSDTLEPDRPGLLTKITQTRLWVRDASGKESSLRWFRDGNIYTLEVPGTGLRTVGGTCVYGIQVYDHRLRKNVPPYLLTYHPKMIVGKGKTAKPWEKLTLEIVPTYSKEGVHLQVLFKGKPAANAEMIVLGPGEKERQELKTDEKGEIKFDAKKAGVHGFRTRYIEPVAGEHQGKEYQEIRHYASLVLTLEK